ncbi:uncharacterized protein ACLA_041510 [Aspergillus clavatus NRRL 1]|uniref:Uncharacterized protein n=1 Tax=Aspergillus clavatus (strain ATCC 1007 / CBS 513.65 / DSM 816 / NCTC 3887 / NRRL 1 / QM 1276 / 107) TaxID=344612 RepID=A1CLA9_ASPCL|nr:uncharacterized protein ACLA_041510 [Aspergillus clavatus NRRL 1]EAW09933.1 hypothetical protein ACLA_041510 [Aspergillus clavatus NRRL 1]
MTHCGLLGLKDADTSGDISTIRVDRLSPYDQLSPIPYNGHNVIVIVSYMQLAVCVTIRDAPEAGDSIRESSNSKPKWRIQYFVLPIP